MRLRININILNHKRKWPDEPVKVCPRQKICYGTSELSTIHLLYKYDLNNINKIHV